MVDHDGDCPRRVSRNCSSIREHVREFRVAPTRPGCVSQALEAAEAAPFHDGKAATAAELAANEDRTIQSMLTEAPDALFAKGALPPVAL